MTEEFSPLTLTDARRVLWASRSNGRTVRLGKLRATQRAIDVCGTLFLPGADPLHIFATQGFVRLRVALGFVHITTEPGVLLELRVEQQAGPVVVDLAEGVRLALSGPGADDVKLTGTREATAIRFA